MSFTLIPLTTGSLCLASGLVLFVGGLSFALRLGLERSLAIASCRTVVQLLLVGYILQFVFTQRNPVLILGIIAIMIAAACQAAIHRPTRTFPEAWWMTSLTLTLVCFCTTLTVTRVIIQTPKWYTPQYLIPLFGMNLGSCLTGISLCLDYLLEALAERRDEVEMELGHGATRWEAARGLLRAAVRRGMIPTLNAMLVVGLVSLPGMMTGQILGHGDPLTATRYQIVVMFMIAAAVASSCIFLSLMVFFRLFNKKHQLEVGRLRRQDV